MREEKLTPMLSQYREIKKQYPDVLLLFRLGDFYELFGEDAEVGARVLELTLTSRPVGKNTRLPMCGIPYHAAERYIARLIQAGMRVAICDQMEDPKLARGIVRREVTRVVTPGTVLEDGMLDARSNNYLTVVYPIRGAYGIASADVSTGEFAVTQVDGEAAGRRALDEIARLSPAECLIPPECDIQPQAAEILGRRLAPLTPDPLAYGTAAERLAKHLGTTSLRGFGCQDLPAAIEAAAALIDYLKAHQASAAEHLKSLSTYSLDHNMVLDAQTRRNLELTEGLGGPSSRGLLQVLDRTVTPMGARLLRRWLLLPLLDVAEISRRQEAVADLVDKPLVRADVRAHLKRVSDIERLTSRAVAGTCTPRDLAALRDSLEAIPHLNAAAQALAWRRADGSAGPLDEAAEVRNLLSDALQEDPPANLRDGGVIRAGYDAELERLRSASREGKTWIAALEQSERERTGIKSLKVGFNAVFGYYIEVSKSNLGLVPDTYIRKQTTTAGERFVTPELKEHEAMVLGAEERIVQLEAAIFTRVREQVAEHSARLLAVARNLAELDLLCSLAEVAQSHGYVRPVINTGQAITIRGGRHPVVETASEEPFVPNDTEIGTPVQRVIILTGPNMAGKSTYLRQVALIVLMAQIGSFVPADEATIGIVDRIFTRIGAQDDLAGGRSTFMVEMNESANILNNATSRSLVVLDEVGRGTSTFDGLSIAWAMTEYLARLGPKTLFATHYHQLNDLEKRLPGVRNFRVLVKEAGHQIVWLRKVVPGGTDKSYGIQVARLAGMPEAVISRARQVLQDLEENGRGVKPGKVSEATKRLQLTFLEPDRHPVVEEIRNLDLQTITPLEALQKLAELQKQLKG
jgi:DNA mismatch repair protein MutS